MKLNPNTNDSCIRFNLNMTKKELNISIDSNLKASLQDSVDADNEYESLQPNDSNTPNTHTVLKLNYKIYLIII